MTLTISASDDTAVGIDGDFLIAGTTQGVEDAIDAKGDNFAGVDDSTTGLDEVPDNSLFSLYADPQKAIDLIKAPARSRPTSSSRSTDQLAQMGDGPVDAWGTVTDSSMGFGASAPAAEDAPDPTDLITTLPADSWIAFAAADVGDQIAVLDRSSSRPASRPASSRRPPTLPRKVDPIAMFQDATGLNLEEDLAWIGDVGGFVEGTSIFGLGGGIVITTDDEQAAHRRRREDPAGDRPVALGQGDPGRRTASSIQAQGAPIGAQVAVEDGKVVVAAGADTVDDVRLAVGDARRLRHLPGGRGRSRQTG